MKIRIPAHTSQRFNKKGKPAGTIETPELIAEVIEDDAEPQPVPENEELKAAVERYFQNMRLAAQFHMDNYQKPGFFTNDDGIVEASPYDWENSIQFYEGALVYDRIGDVLESQKFKMFGSTLYNQLNGRDKESGVIPWGELGPTKYGLKKRSQWVFGEQAAHFGDETRVKDLRQHSCYMAYEDGLKDCLDGRDLRGLAYLFDTLKPREYDPNEFDAERYWSLLETVCEATKTLGTSDFELFYMSAMLGHSLEKTLKDFVVDSENHIKIKNSVFFITNFISTHAENDGRLRYGTGFVDDGKGNNEAEFYYNELSLIIAPLAWKAILLTDSDTYLLSLGRLAQKMFIHGVNNADLITHPKAFCQNYRYSIDMALELAKEFGVEV